MSLSRRTMFAQVLVGSVMNALWRGESAAQTAETVQYTYDAQGRLTRVVYASGATIDYVYDAVGNRTQVVRSGGAPPGFNQTIQIPGGGAVNLRALADAAGYNGAQNATVVFQLANNVKVTGSPGGGLAIDTGVWPNSTYAIDLTLQISGKAYGGGGQGGAGNGGAGSAGGDALYCRLPLAVTINAGGELKGGGGGSGAGGRGRAVIAGEVLFYPGGGGGGGQPNGAGGAGGTTTEGTATAGGTATSLAVGARGYGISPGANGSFGGAFGAPGYTGGVAYQAGGAGGAAGYAIRKNGFAVTVTNNGTIAGAIG